MEKNFNEYTVQEQVPIVLANNPKTNDILFQTLNHEQCEALSNEFKIYRKKLELDIKRLDIYQELVLCYK